MHLHGDVNRPDGIPKRAEGRGSNETKVIERLSAFVYRSADQICFYPKATRIYVQKTLGLQRHEHGVGAQSTRRIQSRTVDDTVIVQGDRCVRSIMGNQSPTSQDRTTQKANTTGPFCRADQLLVRRW